MKFIALALFFSLTAQAALIVPTSAPSPITADSSSADRMVESAKHIQTQATRGFACLNDVATDVYAWVWHNPLDLNPTAVFNALGKDAASAHLLFLSVKQLLNGAKPGSITVTEPCVVTPKRDGTVSLFCVSPSPSSVE